MNMNVLATVSASPGCPFSPLSLSESNNQQVPGSPISPIYGISLRLHRSRTYNSPSPRVPEIESSLLKQLLRGNIFTNTATKIQFFIPIFHGYAFISPQGHWRRYYICGRKGNIINDGRFDTKVLDTLIPYLKFLVLYRNENYWFHPPLNIV